MKRLLPVLLIPLMILCLIGLATAQYPGSPFGPIGGGGGDADTIQVTDDESTDDAHEVVFTTDNSALESDGTLNYNPSTGTLEATIFTTSSSNPYVLCTDASAETNIATVGEFCTDTDGNFYWYQGTTLYGIGPATQNITYDVQGTGNNLQNVKQMYTKTISPGEGANIAWEGDEDGWWFKAPIAMTIISGNCVVEGSGTPRVYSNIYVCDDMANDYDDPGTDCVAVDTTGSPAAPLCDEDSEALTIDNAAIAAGDWVWVSATNEDNGTVYGLYWTLEVEIDY